MKVYELFEQADESFLDIAKHLGYKKINSSKMAGGKSYDVVFLTDAKTIGPYSLNFQYEINPETNAWTFSVSSDADNTVELDSGEDEESLVKHLKKKRKLSQHNLEKYFAIQPK
jgi:hypothetical protein